MSGDSAAGPSCACLDCGPPIAPAANGSLRVLVGVLTSPYGRGAARRQAIRRSWQLYPEVGSRLIACYVLGRRGVSKRGLSKLDAPDVIWLDTADEGILSMHKVFSWWKAAAVGASHFTHVAKVDDDSYLHVPNLLAELSARASVPHLVLGGLAHASYDPSIFRMCGWQWGRGVGAYRARKCRERGFSPPFPFPLGALQVLSRGLVTAIGTAPAIHAFARAANASADLRKRDSNEDVALGFWVARLAKQQCVRVPPTSPCATASCLCLLPPASASCLLPLPPASCLCLLQPHPAVAAALSRAASSCSHAES